MNETFRYDVLINETIGLYKKKNLLKQNYLFPGNLQFQKFIKTSLSEHVTMDVGRGPNSYAPQPTYIDLSPIHHTVAGETLHSTH